MAQVRDIMQKDVITIEHDKNALDAAKMLKEKEISFLVIVADGKPKGIVSERDIVRKVAAEDITTSSAIMDDVMSRKFRWVSPDTPIEDAVQKMINNNIRRLIVLQDDSLAGVITQTDLAEFLRSRILINKTMGNIESDNV